MTALGDRVLNAVNTEYRSTADVAGRARLEPHTISSTLGRLRARGLVELKHEAGRSLWRLPEDPRMDH
jgi:hypothetical protein